MYTKRLTLRVQRVYLNSELFFFVHCYIFLGLISQERLIMLIATTKNHRFVAAGEVCEIETNEKLVIELFRSNKFIGERDGLNGFRPAKVWKNDAVVWDYKVCGAGPFEFGELLEYGDEYIVAIRDKFSISSVVRIKDFTHSASAKLAGKIVALGGSSLEELLDIKIAVANELLLDYSKSGEESAILEQRKEVAREASAKAAAMEASAKTEARAKREAIVASILSRNTVETWAKDGRKLYGIPVTTDDEWKSLPDGKYCIMMQEGKPIEAFIVEKKNSKVKKFRATEVSAEIPKQKVADLSSEIPEALDQMTVKLHGETKSIFVFEDKAVLKIFQANGLNSSTWIGVLPKGSDFLDVYKFEGGSFKTVGQLKRKNIEHQLEV